MNLFEYVSKMKELNAPTAIAGIVILCLFLVVIFFKMLSGMRRGGYRQIVHTVLTIVSAIVSVIVAVSMSNSIIGSLSGDTINSLIDAVEGAVPGAGEAIQGALNGMDTTVVESIILLPAALLIIPILMVVIFLLLNLIFKIVYLIIYKCFKIKKAQNNNQRLGGVLLGAVEAIIWIMIIVLPISGIITLVDNAYETVLESVEGTEDEEEIYATYEEIFMPFTENPAHTFLTSLGSKEISSAISTVEINGRKTDLAKEMHGILRVALVDIKGLDGADFGALNDENKAAINSIIDALDNSPYISNIVVALLNAAGSTGELIPEDGLDSNIQPVVDEIMLFLSTITTDTLTTDLSTVRDFYFDLSDSGLIKAITDGDDILQVLKEDRKSGKNTINKIVATLNSNPRTTGLKSSLVTVMLRSMTSGSGTAGGTTGGNAGGSTGGNTGGSTGGNTGGSTGPVITPTVEVTYEGMKESMNEIKNIKKEDFATEEEYKQELSNTVETTLGDYGIVDLEPEVIDSVADYVDENFSDKVDDLTDQEFDDLILHYMDIYLEYIDTGVVPDEFEGIGGGNADGGNTDGGNSGNMGGGDIGGGDIDIGGGDIDINEVTLTPEGLLLPNGQLIPAGTPAPFDITLPDGTVIYTGTPVPALGQNP